MLSAARAPSRSIIQGTGFYFQGNASAGRYKERRTSQFTDVSRMSDRALARDVCGCDYMCEQV